MEIRKYRVDGNLTGSSRVYTAFPINILYFMLAWPGEASWKWGKLWESRVFDLDGFYSVQAMKRIRITTSASGNPQGGHAGVQLKQCWMILSEVEMKKDFVFSCPDLLKQVLPLFKEWYRNFPVKRGKVTLDRQAWLLQAQGLSSGRVNTCLQVRWGSREVWIH